MATNCKAYTDTLHCGGAPTVVGEASGNPYMYTGREYDPETGLYFFRNRYQSPILGRFISEDPIGLAGGDMNLYRYVGNDPINYIDPWGLEAGLGGGGTGTTEGKDCECPVSSYIDPEVIDWSRVSLGTLSALEGVQTIGVGTTAIGLTAVTTKNLTLTTIIAAEMTPVFWAGSYKFTHGLSDVKKGFKDFIKTSNKGNCQK